MSRFMDLAIMSPIPGGSTWVMREELEYEVGHVGSGKFVRVPKLFVTDLASVPRLLWVFIDRQGLHTNASIVHDWLYWSQTTSRRTADRTFLEAMQLSGEWWSVRMAMFYGVRWFGWIAWHLNRLDAKAGHNHVLAALPKAADPVPRRGLDRIVMRWFKRKT